MFNVPTKNNKSDPLYAPRAPKLLVRAPKTALAVTVVVIDLVATLLLVPRANTAGEQSDATSCEHGACQRQVTGNVGAETSVLPTGKPRLLEFTSQHCASCNRMAPLVHQMERECTAHDGTILPVNVDTDSGDRLAARYGVNQLPTFVMIDANGAEVGRLVGEQQRQQLVVALADVNGVLCTAL